MVPDSVEVPYNMAAVYQAQGRYDDAVKLLQDLLKKTEKPDTSYSQSDRNNRAIFIERLGMVYREQENYTAAVDTFRKMLTLGDDNARSGYQEIIDTYREAKQWPQATAVAKEAVQKLPNDRDLRMVLDAQLADTGEADKALRRCSLLLKGTSRRSRSLYPPRPYVHPRQALDRRRTTLSTRPSSSPPKPRTRNTSGSCAAILRAPEKIRPGRSRVQESPGHFAPIRRAPSRSTTSAT